MPDLPTVTITDTQAARVLAAFGTIAKYRAWLRAQVTDAVRERERAALIAAKNAEITSGLTAIDSFGV